MNRVLPTGFGYDSTDLPGGDKKPTSPPSQTVSLTRIIHRWILEHTNLRFVGGYITRNTWGRHFEEIWELGFGLSLFDNHDVGSSDDTGWSAKSYFHSHNYQNGEAEARGILERAHGSIGRIKRLSRAVVYVDNEDANKAADVDFYRGLYRFLERQGPDAVRIRPGIYGKPWLAGFVGFLSEFPYLYFCEAVYPRGKHLADTDPRRAPFKPPPPQPGKRPPFSNWPFFDIPSSNPHNVTWEPAYTDTRSNKGLYFRPHDMNALPPKADKPRLRAPSKTGRGPKKPWLEWPVIYQFEGSNAVPPAPSVQSTTVDGTPFSFRFTGNYSMADFESSVVDDPAYPAASPRLALIGPFLTRLDRIDPGASGRRMGRLQFGPYSKKSDSFGAFWEPEKASSRQQFPIAPGVRPGIAELRGGPVVIIPRRDGFGLCLEVLPFFGSVGLPEGSRPVPQALTITPPAGRQIPVHTPFAVASFNAADIHLFVVADDGSLLTTRGKPLDPKWPDLQLHTAKIVHPYSQLEVCTRGLRGPGAARGQDFSVDVFFIGPDLTLHTVWWNSSLPWPNSKQPPVWPEGRVQAIGNPEVLLPTTSLSAVSPDINTILVFGTGFDLLLHVVVWRQSSGWIGPFPVNNDVLLAAHGDLAACWNPYTKRCEIVAVGNDLSLLHFQVEPNTTSRSPVVLPVKLHDTQDASQTTIDTKTGIVGTAVNPFGDVVFSIVGTRRLVVAVFADNGKSVPKWKSADATIEASRSVWTEWQELPSSQPDQAP